MKLSCKSLNSAHSARKKISCLGAAGALWLTFLLAGVAQANPHQRGAWAAAQAGEVKGEDAQRPGSDVDNSRPEEPGESQGPGQWRRLRRNQENAGDLGAGAKRRLRRFLDDPGASNGVAGDFGSADRPFRQGFDGTATPGESGWRRFRQNQEGAAGIGAERSSAGRQGLGAGGRFSGAPINLQKLGLSEEQKQKIRQLRSKNSDKARELRESLKGARLQMRQLMFDPDATEAQIRAKRKQLRQMQDQMEDMQIEDFLSMRSVLSPEQRKRLPEIMPGARGNAAGSAGVEAARPQQ